MLAELDFRNLDDEAAFTGHNTTTEFLARTIFDRLLAAIRDGRLGDGAQGLGRLSVTLHESHVAWASFEGVGLSPRELHLIAPGPLDQRTGGYLYNARIVEGLTTLGWRVVPHALDGSFPEGDAVAEASLAHTLEAIPRGTRVVLDGLGMSSLPDPLRAHRDRLRLLALVHLHLADETGLAASERDHLAGLERDSLAQCAGAVATSAFTARRLGNYGVPASRVRAVLPGTDPARTAVGPGAGEPPRILCVGSVSKRKGQDVLVGALGGIRSLPWSCLCAGSLRQAPEFAESVMELARELGLEDRIEFPGELGAAELDTHITPLRSSCLRPISRATAWRWPRPSPAVSRS